MTLKVKPRQDDIYWIKRNTEKKKRKSEATALDDWASEGGFTANISQAAITSLKGRKRFICYYQRSVHNDNSHHGHQ